MPFHKEIWSYLIVTVVTILIWVWAAGETREQRTLTYARVQFGVADDDNQWVVRPSSLTFTLVVEGSKLALENVESRLRRPLRLEIAAQTGRQTIDLLERVRESEAIRASGVRISSVEPRTIEVELDRTLQSSARINPVLPGVTPMGRVAVDPPAVAIEMPTQLRQRLPQTLTLEAVIDRTELDRLEPGVPHSLDARVRLPEGFSASDVTITPQKVKINFTIRSRIRETTLESVRVQLAGPPEDRDIFQIDLEPKVLRNVTISADADLSRQIEDNEVQVVAVLHLSTREKDARIESKKISYFMALVPDETGGTRGVQVTGKIGDSSEPPVIGLTITERE